RTFLARRPHAPPFLLRCTLQAKLFLLGKSLGLHIGHFISGFFLFSLSLLEVDFGSLRPVLTFPWDHFQAPCCDKLYTCRLCHDSNEDHQLDRFKVKEVQCINCEKIQHAQQICEECSTLFGEYYCSICHLFDKDKKQYHCENCGICRIGPKEDFFHCLKCNLCLAMNLQGKHKCIENVSRQNCPICLEDIHTSRIVAHVLPCGHLLHRTCYEEMLKEGYRCPLCMHSALDMTRYWRQLDDEVAQTPMPSEYQNMTVDILCNDCNGRSTVQFHILGMKCNICESYNTAQAGGCRISLDQQ
uniref:RING finger and CHY zinc finger domain-containing protein 1 n=2 Tax=Sus scrofa TaxID=9823 RepID=A0A8D0QYK8_PIG